MYTVQVECSVVYGLYTVQGLIVCLGDNCFHLLSPGGTLRDPISEKYFMFSFYFDIWLLVGGSKLPESVCLYNLLLFFKRSLTFTPVSHCIVHLGILAITIENSKFVSKVFWC